MKRLILIRHAKSSWNNPGLTDFDRPLNKRGKRDAPVMGKRLKNRDVKPDLIISSPAKRALKTARIIAEEIGYPKVKIVTHASIYGEGMSALLELIRNLDDSHNRVIMFGHNPDFTMLAEHLTDHRVGNMPTCGIFCVDFEVDSWKQISERKGLFVFFDYPKKQA